MNKNSTLSAKCIALIITAIFFSITNIEAQTIPKLIFAQPQLVSGTNGQINATYKFSDVTSGVDAYVSIENIVNGAYLINIDDSTLGYYNAWQPTVGGNGLYGSSYIKWDIKFEDKKGKKYKFPELDATAIDIDGDNVRVRELIGVNGQSDYSVPTQIPSLLTISNPSDTDDINNSDPSNTNLIALGPVINRVGIDTLSQDVRLNFSIKKLSEFKMYTGSEVDSNGTTGAIATNRYHCIYFQDIVGSYGVLPVTYQSFNAALNNNMVHLYWTTDAETNNDHFEVERSFDQTSFSTVGFVVGAQSDNNGIKQYSFKDDNNEILKHNVIYYRLKQVDANGNYNYSVVKIVRYNNINETKLVLQVMPNPYMDKLNVNFDSKNDGKAEIRMISVSGAVVKKIETTINKGFNNVQVLDLSSQLPGMYVVNIVVNGVSVGSQKIIKN
jgi:hypothetical protein